MTDKKTILCDKQEEDGGPHWLSTEGRTNPNALAEIRAKNRARYLAEQEAKRRKSNAP
jgi:hypothetical protein